MSNQQTSEAILNGLMEEIQVHTATAEGPVDGDAPQTFRVQLPFRDGSGDPVEIAVSTDGRQATVDDAGAIAGMMFSLGQHTGETPAFKLIRDLEKAHGLEVDFDQGLVKISVPEQDLRYGIAELAKVVLAFHTVLPHIRVAPRRMKSLSGPRLKSRIRSEYQALKIFHLVEPDSCKFVGEDAGMNASRLE